MGLLRSREVLKQQARTTRLRVRSYSESFRAQATAQATGEAWQAADENQEQRNKEEREPPLVSREAVLVRNLNH